MRGMDFVEFSSYRELCREFHADENASSDATDEGCSVHLDAHRVYIFTFIPLV